MLYYFTCLQDIAALKAPRPVQPPSVRGGYSDGFGNGGGGQWGGMGGGSDMYGSSGDLYGSDTGGPPPLVPAYPQHGGFEVGACCFLHPFSALVLSHLIPFTRSFSKVAALPLLLRLLFLSWSGACWSKCQRLFT